MNDLAFWYVIVRTGIDSVVFILPGIQQKIRKLGWPINVFWLKSIWPVTATMFFSTLMTRYIEPNEFYLIFMMSISVGWAIVLISYKKRTPIMIIDAISWLLVGYASIFLVR